MIIYSLNMATLIYNFLDYDVGIYLICPEFFYKMVNSVFLWVFRIYQKWENSLLTNSTSLSMRGSPRNADLRFDAQRTTKHQIDGCTIFTTIFRFVVTYIFVKMCSSWYIATDSTFYKSVSCRESLVGNIKHDGIGKYANVHLSVTLQKQTFFLTFSAIGRLN